MRLFWLHLHLLLSIFYLQSLVIYRPQRIKKSTFIEEIGDLLEFAATVSGKMIVLGDFNVHVDCRSDPETTDLQSLFDCFDLVQHVDGAMHEDGHTLDLVISRTTDNMVQSCEVGSFVGDHNAIYITMNCCKPHPIRKEKSFRKIRSINTLMALHKTLNLLIWPGHFLMMWMILCHVTIVFSRSCLRNMLWYKPVP